MLKKHPSFLSLFALFLAAALLLSGCVPGSTPNPASDPSAQPGSENLSAIEDTSPTGSENLPPTEDTTPATPAAFSFTDDLGRAVTVENPQRVAALLGSFAHVWTLAGGTVWASADDAWVDFDLPLPEDAVNLGMISELSLELLLAAQPDFILASANSAQNLAWQETLEQTGVPVAYFRVSGFADYLCMLKICTGITGRADLYEANGTAVAKRVQAAIAQSEARLSGLDAPPTVLTLRASASSIRAKNSTGNVLGEMLADLGCVNIADSDETLLEDLSIERILEADPDFIFFVQTGDDPAGTQAHLDRFFDEHPAWRQLTAVREGRVFLLEKALYNLKPNDRWGEAYENLENILASAG